MAFEKNSAPEKASSKQLAILAVLGVVLLGLVIRFVMNRPAAVDASNIAGVPTADASGKNPEDALKDLNDDPTATLLRTKPDLSPGLNTPPQDPFTLSSELHDKVVHPVIVPVPVAVEPADIPPPPPPVVEKVDPSVLKLTGIVNSGRERFALVNGKLVRAGAVLEKIRIVEVRSDRLVCRPQRGGDTFDILLSKELP